MMKNFITILLFSTTAFLTNGAKILGIFPLPGRSHYILGSSLLRELAERGHDVTMISCFSEKEPPKKWNLQRCSRFRTFRSYTR
jgi:hypothetical protein